jgi:hypothetical protein
MTAGVAPLFQRAYVMKFLEHDAIKKNVRALLSFKGPARIAVAYWGKGALELLDLDPNRTDLQILCCLKAGSSDPKVIRQFGAKARQIDNLHAKVFWTSRGAIVGSANVSTNGLPEQDEFADRLIEAGVYLDDNDVLARIKTWFDGLYSKEARAISPADLERAAQERAARQGKWVPKRPFLSALENNPAEFGQQRIAFYLYEEFCSIDEVKAVMKDARDNPDDIKRSYGVFDSTRSDFYTFCRKPPRDYFPSDTVLIEGLYKNGEISKKNLYVRKTFNKVDHRRIAVKGESEWWMPVLGDGDFCDFNYALTNHDKQVISDASEELWNAGRKGVQDDILISLADARPILLRYLGGSR